MPGNVRYGCVRPHGAVLVVGSVEGDAACVGDAFVGRAESHEACQEVSCALLRAISDALLSHLPSRFTIRQLGMLRLSSSFLCRCEACGLCACGLCRAVRTTATASTRLPVPVCSLSSLGERRSISAVSTDRPSVRPSLPTLPSLRKELQPHAALECGSANGLAKRGKLTGALLDCSCGVRFARSDWAAVVLMPELAPFLSIAMCCGETHGMSLHMHRGDRPRYSKPRVATCKCTTQCFFRMEERAMC